MLSVIARNDPGAIATPHPGVITTPSSSKKKTRTNASKFTCTSFVQRLLVGAFWQFVNWHLPLRSFSFGYLHKISDNDKSLARIFISNKPAERFLRSFVSKREEIQPQNFDESKRIVYIWLIVTSSELLESPCILLYFYRIFIEFLAGDRGYCWRYRLKWGLNSLRLRVSYCPPPFVWSPFVWSRPFVWSVFWPTTNHTNDGDLEYKKITRKKCFFPFILC